MHLDEFDEIDYDLIAIHATLEDYRLAYFLNQKLSVTLGKSKTEVGVRVPEGEASFTKFTFEDQKRDMFWSLISNQTKVRHAATSTAGADLFQDTAMEVTTKVFLLPELKKVDYLLKIENNCNTVPVTHIMKAIKSIDRISTVYALVPDNIKSKNNLIF